MGAVGANAGMKVLQKFMDGQGLKPTTQTQRVPRLFSLSICLFLAIALSDGSYCIAQSEGAPPQAVDCGTFLTLPCGEQSGESSSIRVLQDPTASLTGSRNNQDPKNSAYMDSAGRESSQRPSSEATNQLFPPDAVTDLQRLAKGSIGDLLPIFGRDFFKQVPSTFAPGDQISVAPDYVIGPGDDLLLRFWGPESFNGQLTVDRSGSIYVPKVGSIHVAGLRFDELEKQITTNLSRTYRNFTVSVSLGRLRSIQIYVVGEARRPGAYTISALSTVLNALFASGGPNVQGSLRHIQVRRAEKTISEFDLYDLVLHGDKSKDVRLEQGDTIFIPPVGAQAALGGSVRHPAIYELASENTLGDLLKIAGGFSATASSTQISLERIDADHERHAMTVALDSAGNDMKLRDGDVIFAGHIAAGYEKSVTIRGNLANAGRFAWHEGMRLSDIIPDRRSLLTNDYWRERNRLGVPTPLFEPLQSFGSNAQFSSAGDGLQGRPAVNQSSPYPDQSRLQLYPNQVNQVNQDDQPVPIDRYAFEDQSALQNEVGPAASGILNPTTQNVGTQDTRGGQGNSQGTLSGQQQRQSQPTYGTDTLPKPPTRNRINIPAPEIDWSYAVIERLNPDTLKSSLLPFNLGKLVQDHDPTQNLDLRPGDVVTILSQSDLSVPQEERTKYVRVEGEFPGAGVYSVLPNETLDQLVRRAGGLTSKAYLYGSSFSRESARVYQQQSLDEYISSLSTDMERSSAVRAASSTTGIVDPNALTEQRSLVTQLRQLRATGRVVLEFSPASTGVGSIPSIPLENGDIFRVPARPDTVSVIGAVYGQNVFLYNSTRKLRDYIALAGKPNRIADNKHAFIIRADGSVFSRERAKGVWSNEFDNARINPGDAIVVPEKLIRPTALKELLDYSQILSSFGLAAAGIAVLK